MAVLNWKQGLLCDKKYLRDVFSLTRALLITMGECNTILIANTLCRHLE